MTRVTDSAASHDISTDFSSNEHVVAFLMIDLSCSVEVQHLIALSKHRHQ